MGRRNGEEGWGVRWEVMGTREVDRREPCVHEKGVHVKSKDATLTNCNGSDSKYKRNQERTQCSCGSLLN